MNSIIVPETCKLLFYDSLSSMDILDVGKPRVSVNTANITLSLGGSMLFLASSVTVIVGH